MKSQNTKSTNNSGKKESIQEGKTQTKPRPTKSTKK